MDTLHVVFGVAVVGVLLWAFLRAQSSGGKNKKDEGDQKWRTGQGQNIDPQLRNRHGIQNGEIKVWRKSEVLKHNSPEDLFIIVQNKVYDVSDYVEDHPGGAAAIVRYPGQDCTEQFSGIQHPAKVWDVIQDYYVGELDPKEHTVYTFKTVSKL